MDNATLGKRVKSARESSGLTLKAVEASAGISATHVSEIERGKTSPTLGALSRLAQALGRDPAFFLEDEALSSVSLVTADSRLAQALPGGKGTFEALTMSIPGGDLQARFITLEGGRGQGPEPQAHRGEEAAVVLRGSVRFSVGNATYDVAAGDTIHFQGGEAHRYWNHSRDESAVMIWFATRRDVD